MPHHTAQRSLLQTPVLGLGLWIAASGCARDDTLKVFREDPIAPKARITDPATNQRFVVNSTATFNATVSDEDHDPEDLTITWRSDVAGAVEGTKELIDGVSTFRTDELSLGQHVITVEVVDPDTEVGSDSVEITIVQNTAPKIVINAPSDESVWSDGDTVWVAVQVSDDEDDAAALRLDWSLDGEPVLGATSSADATGEAAHGFEGLSVDAHTVEVTVIDVQGDTASASVNFSVVYGDVDGDGFISTEVGGEDCDDTNAEIHPDAIEVCDDIDNDCDTLIDIDDDSLEGAYTGHLDTDGDGYGSTDVLTSCDADALISDDSDCDDDNASVFPGAEEICNEIDDDCDGLIDGLDPDTDQDGDGHTTCDGDCDDEDATVHPDATEVCDEVDNDCDGTTDGATATDAISYYIDDDGDGYGSPDSVTLACEEPSGHTLDTSDCNDGDDEIHPGAEELCGDGIDNDCDGEPGDCKWTGDVPLDEADHVTYGEDDEDNIASSMQVGDLNGDGINDLIIGAHKADPTALNSGALYLVPGPLSETWGSLETHAELRLDGAEESDWAGESHTLADIDDDGWLDLIVGAPQADMSTGSNAGAAYVHYGPITGSGMLADGDAVIAGESSNDRLGKGMAAGDLDGDGVIDLAIGAEDNDNYATTAGAVYLYLGGGGRLSGDLSVTDADTRFYATQANMEFGQTISFPGDVNGDGRDDLLIGAPRSDDGEESAGGVYLFLGHESDYSLGNAVLHTVAQAEYLGEDPRDYAGTALDSLGDVDGDGRAEFAIGAFKTDSDVTTDGDVGSAYLMLDPDLSGTVSLAAEADVSIHGVVDDQILGSSLAGNFDLDSDGELDLAIGSPSERRGYANQGVTYLLYGPLTALPAELSLAGSEDAAFIGEAASDRAGTVLVTGDMNNDGMDDLGISATGMSPVSGLWDTGATYVLFGGGM